ncbi:glycoside hydrolase family 97 protein [uncultured Alistipes sp.]|uniref:glycoside hydrolase family 97 protein n=1 Tax=uncultured Alistipes sp. TaxID=538949 RepID=UPI002803EE55|nr:glycoside hydrolase family 97 protein [uncultured Alistipes sp.]
MKRPFLLAAALLFAAAASAQKSYTLSSPDGRLQTTVAAGEELTYDIRLEGRTLLEASPLALELDNGSTWGAHPRVIRTRRTRVDRRIASPFYRADSIDECYNALTLRMKGDWEVEFRAYDDGVAYRFVNRSKRPFHIVSERVEYRFPDDFQTTVPYVATGREGDLESQLHNSFENTYTTAPLSEMNPGRLAFLPLVVDAGEGVKLCLSESDLCDYPGLYLRNADGGQTLSGYFAPCPAREEQGGHNRLQMLVREREAYIAQVDAPRSFPWRMAVVGSDTQLAASSMSYLLAAPSKINDRSWIRPGKVAWEWWNDWNLAGVDFRTGVNNQTYRYYIDFAAAHGIEYVILDEGWAVNLKADLFEVVPEINLPELVEYADRKGVGIILWAGYHAFNRDMERVCRHYAEMGVKGFKVDFMDRDDQSMTAFNHRAAETAARYHLLLDLHGTHKPAGMNRTWPNVLNFEGVYGLEQMKWNAEKSDQMEYDTTIPFIRQVAGPMDYTQGAMLNASRGNAYSNYSEPMSQGTRCHQLALYVVLDSPLNMLCDSPTNYEREEECTSFIAGIPTVWDETRILAGELGEYIVTARRKGTTWYIGGITDWTPRDLQLDLSFVGSAATAELFRDGVNADRKASDYRREEIRLDPSHPFAVHLAPGGGFTLKVQGR